MILITFSETIKLFAYKFKTGNQITLDNNGPILNAKLIIKFLLSILIADALNLDLTIMQ